MNTTNNPQPTDPNTPINLGNDSNSLDNSQPTESSEPQLLPEHHEAGQPQITQPLNVQQPTAQQPIAQQPTQPPQAHTEIAANEMQPESPQPEQASSESPPQHTQEDNTDNNSDSTPDSNNNSGSDQSDKKDDYGSDKSKLTSWSKMKTGFWLFVPIIILLLILLGISLTNPDVAAMMVKVLLTLITIIFIAFVILGALVIIGLRKQAQAFLSLLFEGGVRYITLAQAASELWDSIIATAKELILLVSPVFAILLAVFFYYVVMYSFRYVAVTSDVTFFTIVLTVLLACLTAGLGQTNLGKNQDGNSFSVRFSNRFGRVFVDAIEIVVIVLFLTLDMKNPFFLPESMHGEVLAEAFGVDFMQRGTNAEGLVVTLRIAGLAIFVDIIRKIFRIIAATVIHFKSLKKKAAEMGYDVNKQSYIYELLRLASRKAFKDNLDDITKFISFTTIIVLGFFLFPRLKLLSLFFFNLTLLIWDILIPDRAVRKASTEDLLSRIIGRALKIEEKA